MLVNKYYQNENKLLLAVVVYFYCLCVWTNQDIIINLSNKDPDVKKHHVKKKIARIAGP